MNLVSFFDSDELELPRSWETYPGSFGEYVDQVLTGYKGLFRQIEPRDYLSNRVAREYGLAASISDALLRSIMEYFLGHPPTAYKHLAQALSMAQHHFQAMFSSPDIAAVISHLYRIRAGGKPVASARDVFHVPFEERHNCASYRYSILGLPCLYLGSSVYICWEELGRPSIDSIYLARFATAPGATFQVLDLGWRPAWFAALIDSGWHTADLDKPSRLSDLITAKQFVGRSSPPPQSKLRTQARRLSRSMSSRNYYCNGSPAKLPSTEFVTSLPGSRITFAVQSPHRTLSSQPVRPNHLGSAGYWPPSSNSQIQSSGRPSEIYHFHPPFLQT